uniref:Uncharacterized protein n=1 Tax=Tanacetum cinerariifolium TaxID=118510 RepID=A0A699HTV2_TANCI|nr:hypothetical protein [Tanacetum cinerariifolium]
MVNPTIYVSCIKQFWASATIKNVNDVVQLRALIYRKKRFFVEFARMGYEKPPPKLTFYKAFFSAQWKFLIHTLAECVSAKRTAWNEFSCSPLLSYALLQVAEEDEEDEVEYALMVNPTIYVSCIKQFWASATIKNGNDVVQLCALIYRKKVVVTEDVIRQDIRLDDADGVKCLPNAEIFCRICTVLVQRELHGTSSVVPWPLLSYALLQVADLEQDKNNQALEIIKLKKRVKKLERKRKSKHLGLMRLQKVGEVPSEGSRSYRKIIRVGGITKAYQSFKDILKGFDREDLVALWRLVKEKFRTTVPNVDKEKAYGLNLRDYLKQMQMMCYGSFKEKNYPLSNRVMTLMLSTKLQIEEDDKMARDLVMKIFMKANQPKSKSLDTSSK